jgi:hypothetical protein
LDETTKYTLYGTVVRPIKATWVYTPAQSTPTTVIDRPTRGKVSLFVAPGYHFVNDAHQSAATVHRLMEEYSSILDVTWLGETTGYDAGRLIPDPSKEAPRIAEFVHSYLKVDAPVVVWARPPAGKLRDDRLVYGPNPNLVPGAWFVLVDKNGMYRSINEFGLLRLRHMIEELSRQN